MHKKKIEEVENWMRVHTNTSQVTEVLFFIQIINDFSNWTLAARLAVAQF